MRSVLGAASRGLTDGLRSGFRFANMLDRIEGPVLNKARPFLLLRLLLLRLLLL